MTTFWARRAGRSLLPDGLESIAELEKLPLDEVFKVEVKQPRSLQHHKLYWSLCKRIGDAIGVESEHVSDVLKIATGHCTRVKTTTYGEVALPKSISFASMDQGQFKEFFDRCLLVIYEEWGIKRADILAAIKDLLKE